MKSLAKSELLSRFTGLHLWSTMRWTVFSMWLVKLGVQDLSELAYLPPESFYRPGLVAVISDSFWNLLLSRAGLTVFQILAIVFCVCGVLGFYFRITATIALSMLILHQGLIRSFGPMNHAEMTLLCATGVIVLRGWGLLAGTVNKDARESLLALEAPMYIAYTFVGVRRFATGGISVFNADSMRYWILRNESYEMPYALSIAPWAHSSDFVMGGIVIGFAIVTILEASACICLVWRRYAVLFGLAMTVFHLSAVLFLNVLFWENALLLGVVTALGVRKEHRDSMSNRSASKCEHVKASHRDGPGTVLETV